MVHLGYIPDYVRCGLCGNIEDFLEEAGYDSDEVEAVMDAMWQAFYDAGLNVDFPVEGSHSSYSTNPDKFRGPWAAKRRELAKGLAVVMVKYAREAAYETNIHPSF
jgi:hypothetical protein